MTKKKIGEILIEQGLITAEQLDLALKIQHQGDKGLLGVILLDLKLVSPEDLMRCLEIQKKSEVTYARMRCSRPPGS
ncbi:MAG TPA: hypothetical protein PK573_17445 [Spirochaetota bacterium]|nr:hypothetical protein [Spirochaetota bacterium]HRZ27043.1 hypothetical protein [Spirochaetota bacterium]HSA13998.1 hypothetical protein [Spirochaetota bacterium]